MAKDKKAEISEDSAFELIELASDELEVLARAFDVIKEVCSERENPKPYVSDWSVEKVH